MASSIRVFGDNPQAIKHPWVWALIHGGLVLAASVAHVVAWRTNENQLLRDPLTGLPSRVLYLNNLKLALERLGRGPDRSVAVLFLDLDRFKVINDSLGHGEGDELLVAVAERVSHSLHRHETLARFGGDEFVILCEDIFDDAAAVAVAERVLKAFSLPFQFAHGETMAAASIGISVTSDPNQDPDDLIRDADAAMYRAKGAGGARVVLFDEVTRERALARLHNEQAIRKAIEREEFRVFFQPEVSIDGDRITGLEALASCLRLRAPRGSPARTSRCARQGRPGLAPRPQLRLRGARPGARARARTGAAAGRSPGTRSAATG